MHTQPHDFSHDAQHIIAGDVLDQFYACGFHAIRTLSPR